MEIFTDEYFMKEALKEAKIAFEKGEVPVGAVITYNNQIIAKAHNLTETLNDITAHAEILAITSASQYLNSKYLSDCTLYVTLEPCTMCCGALYWSKIGKIIYSSKDEKRGGLSNNINLHPKTIVGNRIMENNSSLLLIDFFNTKR